MVLVFSIGLRMQSSDVETPVFPPANAVSDYRVSAHLIRID